MRVSPELIEVRDRRDRVAAAVRRRVTDVFQVQADVAGQVAGRWTSRWAPASSSASRSDPPQSLTAYDAYLKGEASRTRSAPATPLARARRSATTARLAVDSSFTLAWARAPQAHAPDLLPLDRPIPAEGAAARAAAERAMAFVPSGPRAIWPWATTSTGSPKRTGSSAMNSRCWGSGATPRDAECWSPPASTERTLGRWEEALQNLQHAGPSTRAR